MKLNKCYNLKIFITNSVTFTVLSNSSQKVPSELSVNYQ